jgi:hypothetical protein
LSVKQITATFEQVLRIMAERSVFAIFDLAGQPSVAQKLNSFPANRALSLLSGTRFDAYTAVSPHIVRMDSELAAWIGRDLWKDPWGILIVSEAALEPLFQHFQHFLQVRTADGNPFLFRFFDPRILPTFLASADAQTFGFWHQIGAFAWSQGEAATLARWTADPPPAPDLSQSVTLSAELMRNFKKLQFKNFLDRSLAYLALSDADLPADPPAFILSLLRYAVSAGIENEVDLVRFFLLVCGWKQMPSIGAAREILSYPALPGTDKVDLLCEMAAFGGYASSPADAPGLDREAHRQALIGFLGKHKSDAQFLRAHPDGRLTTRPADARWRKEWVQLYSEKVASLAQVTNVPVGSALI